MQPLVQRTGEKRMGRLELRVYLPASTPAMIAAERSIKMMVHVAYQKGEFCASAIRAQVFPMLRTVTSTRRRMRFSLGGRARSDVVRRGVYA